jgi:hypothetical protein
MSVWLLTIPLNVESQTHQEVLENDMIAAVLFTDSIFIHQQIFIHWDSKALFNSSTAPLALLLALALSK